MTRNQNTVHTCQLLLTYVEVGGCPHLSVFGNDINDQRVSHQSDQHDEGEEQRNQPGVGEKRMLISFRLCTVWMFSLREVCFRSVDPDQLGGVPQLLGGVHGAGAMRRCKRSERKTEGSRWSEVKRQRGCAVCAVCFLWQSRKDNWWTKARKY